MGPLESRGFGGDGGGETPVPIPNTEVKPACADGTWVETPRESRSPPISHDEGPQPIGWGPSRVWVPFRPWPRATVVV